VDVYSSGNVGIGLTWLILGRGCGRVASNMY
jgi:hypothetical protein